MRDDKLTCLREENWDAQARLVTETESVRERQVQSLRKSQTECEGWRGSENVSNTVLSVGALTSCPGCLMRKESSVRQQWQREGTLWLTALHSAPLLSFLGDNERYSSRWHFKSPLHWPHDLSQTCRRSTSEHNARLSPLTSDTDTESWGASCSHHRTIHTSSMADALTHLQYVAWSFPHKDTSASKNAAFQSANWFEFFENITETRRSWVCLSAQGHTNLMQVFLPSAGLVKVPMTNATGVLKCLRIFYLCKI